MSDDATKYLSLVRAFVAGAYMDLWRHSRDSDELGNLNAVTDDALDRVFTATDVHCSDPEIRGEYELDDDQLREFVKSVQPSVERLRQS